MRAQVFARRPSGSPLRLLAMTLAAPVMLALVVAIPIAVGAVIESVRLTLEAPEWFGALFGLPGVLAGLFVALSLSSRIAERISAFSPRSGRIVVGAEGVRVEGASAVVTTRWLDVRDVVIESVSVVLVTRDGARIPLVTGSSDALAAALAAARSAYADIARAEVPAALDSEPDTNAWIARARSLLVQDAYRQQRISVADLAAVLGDPDAPASARLGAAAALNGSSAAMRTRVAEVRDASIDDELAKAIDDVIEERIDPVRWAALARRR